jgi:hypothetical protein
MLSFRMYNKVSLLADAVVHECRGGL